MKKKNLRLFLLFGVMILLIALIGCQPDDSPGAQSDTAEKNTTINETSEKSETTEASETTDQSETEEESETTESFDDLVDALTEYLYYLNIDIESENIYLWRQIDDVKSGYDPLLVSYDGNDSYYVGAYYGEVDETYQNCQNYTWVRFNNANDITEYYDGLRLLAAFQIDTPTLIKNILNEDVKLLNFGHFLPHTPIFENGKNTAEPLTFEKMYIYLNSSKKSNVYHSTDKSDINSGFSDMQCICIEEKNYITVLQYTLSSDGRRIDVNLKSYLGKYYDSLMEIMITDKYSEADEKGLTRYYGLFDIEEFVNKILK